MSGDGVDCEGYDGAVYQIHSDRAPFLSPDNQVAVNTVTYVQGRGMSVRIVSVPGSDWNMFFEEAEPYGICRCMPPAIWHFTGFAEDGTVGTMTTLNGHDAVHYMHHPDHLFGEKPETMGGLAQKLPCIPAEEGLDMVMRELIDKMTDLGVPGLKDPSEMSYDEVKSADVEDFLSKFFENGDGNADNG